VLSTRFKTLTLIAAAASVVGSLAYVPTAEAFNFGNMMNPSRWMGGDRDRYDDDYYDDGPYGGRGWGGGPWGGPGYGGPGYGYGAPGYGGYGAPGYGVPAYGAPAVAAPAPAAPAPAAAPSKGSAGEVEALKRRIEELESSQRPAGTSAPASNDWPSAPAFRPMSKY